MSLQRLLAKKLASEQIDRLVSAELQRLLSCCAPNQVILFGSAARAEATDQSDLDLIVLFSDEHEADDAKKDYYRLALPRSYPVDILFMSVEEYTRKSLVGGVCMVASNEGRVIYCRGDKDGTT
jgi:predicted nucleotidyltransferase